MPNTPHLPATCSNASDKLQPQFAGAQSSMCLRPLGIPRHPQGRKGKSTSTELAASWTIMMLHEWYRVVVITLFQQKPPQKPVMPPAAPYKYKTITRPKTHLCLKMLRSTLSIHPLSPPLPARSHSSNHHPLTSSSPNSATTPPPQSPPQPPPH